MRFVGCLAIIFLFHFSGFSQPIQKIEFNKFRGNNLEEALKILRQRENFALSYDPIAVSKIDLGSVPKNITTLNHRFEPD